MCINIIYDSRPMKLTEFIKTLFKQEVKHTDKLIPLKRNEVCYCGSNKKYKRCHWLSNSNNNKVACNIFDKDGQPKGYRLYNEEKKTFKAKSNLRWADVGRSGNGPVE